MKKLINKNIELLNLMIAGSVDDGKSTLIGRLFYDTKNIYDDQLEALKKNSFEDNKEKIDFSLFTDGLGAEREQKITIDVGYKYFSTSKRRFNIADVPGHDQYTRNMVTAASNSNVAMLLVDIRKGLLPQTKRHLFISSMMGIAHILVVVNKVDLVEYSQEKFEKFKEQMTDFSAKLNIPDLQFVPVSALNGDMIVYRGENMGWYQGGTVLSYLENLEIISDRNLIDFRLPIQYVSKSDKEKRYYFGQVASGVIEVGAEIIVLPSGQKTKIESIIIDDKKVKYAFNPQGVALTMEDNIDISRGNMLVRKNNLPEVGNGFEAMICWMSDKPAEVGKSYIIKHTTNSTRCFIEQIRYSINIDDLHRQDASSLKLNDVGRVSVKTIKPIIFDSFSRNKNTGSFIIIDEDTNNTVAAGIILYKTRVLEKSKDKKAGKVFWFTGLSGSGKSTIADGVYEELVELGVPCQRLDGDLVREGMSRDLGFSKEDRDENISRVAFLSKLLSQHGIVVLATFISPYESHREMVRKSVKDFVEVFVDTPLEECEKRDTKGLYKKARAGEIENFTGISDPYESPKNPEIEIDTTKLSIEESTDKILSYLKKHSL